MRSILIIDMMSLVDISSWIFGLYEGWWKFCKSPVGRGARQIYGEKVSWPSLAPTRRRVPDSVWWLSQLMKLGIVGRCSAACAVISSA